MFYIVREHDQTLVGILLHFPEYESSNPSNGRLTRVINTEIAGEAEFQASGAVVTVLNKYRGLGDCGTFATYRIKDDTVALSEIRAKLHCDGKNATDPDRWPLLPSQ